MDLITLLPFVHLLSGFYSPPALPGVYAIGYWEYSPLAGRQVFVPVYIGETNNLFRRFREHSPYREQDWEMRNFLIRYRNWLEFRHERVYFPRIRKRMEKQLIAFHQPRFNKTHQSAWNSYWMATWNPYM